VAALADRIVGPVGDDRDERHLDLWCAAERIAITYAGQKPVTGFRRAFPVWRGDEGVQIGYGAFPGNPITGEPGVWYLSGRLFANFDADGNLTSTGNTGNLVDLCPRLAS
jgi:hypothetical protein